MIRRLGAGAFWAFTANGVYAAAQWLALVLVAKLTTPAEVGQYALALAITGPIILFTNLQLAGLLATDAHGSFRFEQYFALRLVSTCFALALILSIAVGSRLGQGTTAVLGAIALSRCIEALSEAVYGLVLRRGALRLLFRSLGTNAVLSFVLFAALLVGTRSVSWAAAGWCAGSLLTFAFLNVGFALRAIAPGVRWPSREALRLLSSGLREPAALMALGRQAAPLGVVSALLSLQTYVPQYVIQHEIGAAAVGRFSAAAYPLFFGSLAMTAIGQSSASHFSEAIKANHQSRFLLIVGVTVGAGLLVGVGLIVGSVAFGGAFLTLAYSPDYASAQTVLVTLALASAIRFTYQPLGVGMTAARRIGLQIWIRAASLATAIAAVTIGVTRTGIQGAAMALVATSALEGAIWMLIVVAGLKTASLFRHPLVTYS
jgi:O-antigen/teichoic acid export membrane protein